jgi:cysteine desulfurase
VELARSRVASLLRIEAPEQLTFTSGATEANNWVLRSFPKTAVSPFEHSSIIEPAHALGLQILENEELELREPKAPVELISVMAVNNEIGTIFQLPSLPGAHHHSDITQAVGKLDIELSGLDFASFSAHKFYGPKGVGALYSKNGPPPPLLIGGEQEVGARGGTLNVPAIVGMGAAAAIAQDRMETDYRHAAELRGAVLEALTQTADIQVNGGDSVSPYILSVSFKEVEGETLVIEMDQRGFAISSGAACSSRSTEPSHVLQALGLSTEWLRGTVRISFGRWNTLESARALGKALAETVEALRRLRTF